MKISNIKAFSLGVFEREGTKKNGEEYNLFCFSFLIENESEARKLYLAKEDKEKRKIFRKLEDWGKVFRFSGEIDGAGKVDIQEIVQAEDNDFDFNVQED